MLLNRESNEAYLTYKQGETYIVFFPDKGEVGLDLTKYDYDFALRWMNLREGKWESEKKIIGGEKVILITPENKERIAVIIKIQ